MKRTLNYLYATAFVLILLLFISSCNIFGKHETESLALDKWEEFAAMTPQELREFEIDVVRKIADLALIPPVINTSPLPEFDYDQLDYGMTPWIERTSGGRLWCAWVGGEDGPNAFILAATSDDDGVTWSKPRLVINSHSDFLPLPRTTLVGCFWTDPAGKLWMFFDQVINYADGRHGVWAAYCENPDADDPVWSAPQRIWHGVMLNKPIVLSTGEWVLATNLLQYKAIDAGTDRGDGLPPTGPAFGVRAIDGTMVPPYAGPCIDYINDSRCPHPATWAIFPELDPYRGVNIIVSEDQGKSWQWRGHVSVPDPDWHEPMVVEREDGSLWMLIRIRGGIKESFSYDKGKSWSEPQVPETIRHPQTRFYFGRLASGRILLVKHGETIDSHEGRSKLSAWLTEDEGKSWLGGLMIDERGGVSYPDATQGPDGQIYVVHDRERIRLGEILLSRITEEDILAGELVTPGSELSRVIIRPMKNK